MFESSRRGVSGSGDVDARRLVLGFDGGCGTCLDLARKIDEQVGEKLEVQNLGDPQVMGWREEALGENAPWAPTLFEVNGDKVRAWTGLRLGLVLSRHLGPRDTWRVMRALGGTAFAPRAAKERGDTVLGGLSRGQFLKGVGGAAVAMSVLSASGGLAPAMAKTGTREQRLSAWNIATTSSRFQNLNREQVELGGSSFDYGFDDVRINIADNDRTAAVRITADGDERAVIAVFLVDLRRDRVFSHIHHVFRRVNEGRDIAITRFGNGQAERPYHRTVLGVRGGESYAFTEDGRRLTLKQFDEEVRRRAQRSRAASVGASVGAARYSSCEACLDDRTLTCQSNFGYFCIGAGVAALFAGPFGIPIGGGSSSAARSLSCSVAPARPRTAAQRTDSARSQPPQYRTRRAARAAPPPGVHPGRRHSACRAGGAGTEPQENRRAAPPQPRSSHPAMLVLVAPWTWERLI